LRLILQKAQQEIANISGLTQTQARKRGGSSTLLKSRVEKQARGIPNLIFKMEAFEKHVVKIGAHASVNLMDDMKSSTSRDFKIHWHQFAPEEEEEEEEEEEVCNKLLLRSLNGF